ncbi:hypothetical protein Gogos_020880 [Gossypium gossypioides]|uniref:NAC domain-containing protein n=1 Tax=Gossypium gossypioides TaxID=34282 RepID=A0A7J9D808_GOSGO|nr:hypothetical protein [Gossypium gossypioides]
MDLDIYNYQFKLIGILLGYQFGPNDVELIQYYLLKMVKGKPLPYNTISKYGIYRDQGKES